MWSPGRGRSSGGEAAKTRHHFVDRLNRVAESAVVANRRCAVRRKGVDVSVSFSCAAFADVLDAADATFATDGVVGLQPGSYEAHGCRTIGSYGSRLNSTANVTGQLRGAPTELSRETFPSSVSVLASMSKWPVTRLIALPPGP